MGGSPEYGGMWTEQAPASFFTNDADRSTSPASAGAFIPSLATANPMGNSGRAEPEEPPALFTIRYIKASQRRSIELPWRPNVALKYYLQQAGLIGTRLHSALKINGRNVRMSYVPQKGDVLVMSPVSRAMS